MLRVLIGEAAKTGPTTLSWSTWFVTKQKSVNGNLSWKKQRKFQRKESRWLITEIRRRPKLLRISVQEHKWTSIPQ